MAELTKELFCARHQDVTLHRAEVDDNGEYVFYCIGVVGSEKQRDPESGAERDVDVLCDRFIKFPADTTPEQFASLVTAHRVQNTGQVVKEKQENNLRALLGVTLQDAEPTQPQVGVNEEVAANPQPENQGTETSVAQPETQPQVAGEPAQPTTEQPNQ